jgi:hypothetical protein
VCPTVHSVTGIRAEVHDNLLDLGRVCENVTQLLAQIQPYFDGCRHERPQKLEAFAHYQVSLDLLRFLFTLAAEGENLLDQVLSAQT